MLLESTIDQYSNVRQSIKKLFHPINCKSTYSFDKKDKHLLASNNLLSFIESEENGFKDFCSYLKNQVELISYHESYNFNEKISYRNAERN